MISKEFGNLLVTSKTNEKAHNGELIWNCICRCGKTTKVRTSKLTEGRTKSCGSCNISSDKPFPSEARKRALKKKGKKRFSDLSVEDQLKCLNEFALGHSRQALSDKYLVSYDTLRHGIKSFRQKLNSAYELEYMLAAEKTELPIETIESALSTTLLTDKLKDICSGDTDETLSQAELLYCYIWVHTGSNDTALKESGFSEILDTKSSNRKQLFGMFLRDKPNLKQYIQTLQKIQLEEVKASKQHVQYELTKQVEQLREAVARGGRPSDRGHLLRAIELLGKTVGAFEERVRITEVSAADALDNLLDMVKAEAKVLPEGEPTDEHWELREETNA
jgi:hypothetical protein